MPEPLGWPNTSMHEWQINAVALGVTAGSFGSLAQSPIRVLAVCSRCGVIRTQVVPGPKHERHIDLRGACPGKPQTPEDLDVPL